MKRIFRFLLVVFIVFMTVSCSKETTSSNYRKKIIGTWQLVDPLPSSSLVTVMFIFEPERMTQYFDYTLGNFYIDYEYKIIENSIYLDLLYVSRDKPTFGDLWAESFDKLIIKKLTKETLVLDVNGDSWSFERSNGLTDEDEID